MVLLTRANFVRIKETMAQEGFSGMGDFLWAYMHSPDTQVDFGNWIAGRTGRGAAEFILALVERRPALLESALVQAHLEEHFIIKIRAEMLLLDDSNSWKLNTARRGQKATTREGAEMDSVAEADSESSISNNDSFDAFSNNDDSSSASDAVSSQSRDSAEAPRQGTYTLRRKELVFPKQEDLASEISASAPLLMSLLCRAVEPRRRNYERRTASKIKGSVALHIVGLLRLLNRDNNRLPTMMALVGVGEGLSRSFLEVLSRMGLTCSYPTVLAMLVRLSADTKRLINEVHNA